jgi:hypothetical protein
MLIALQFSGVVKSMATSRQSLEPVAKGCVRAIDELFFALSISTSGVPALLKFSVRTQNLRLYFFCGLTTTI